MNIIDHGKWIEYRPVPYPEDLPDFTLFCKRESDNQDWYEFIYEVHEQEPTEKWTEGPARGTNKPFKGPKRIKRVRAARAAPTVKCTAIFQPSLNACTVGPAVYDITRLYPVHQYMFEITDYVGTDPQADIGGMIYDPVALTLAPKPVRPPEVMRSLMVERLHTAGKLQQLHSFLNSHLYERERWYANIFFKANDAVTIAMLNDIGADPAVILAPP